MKEILEKIQFLTEPQLRQLMEAIQIRFQNEYPQLDILYLTLHKDPDLRRQELTQILQLITGCTQWQLHQLTQLPLS